MNRLIIFVCTLIVHLTVIAAVTGSGLGYPVVLNGPQNSHLIDTEPEATIGFVSGALTVTLDATHYASYTVTLTSPAGDSVTVNATSPTVTIPVNGDSDGYVVTIDGGDYGTYDGVFSRSGASTVTLTDQQAFRLVKNRRQRDGEEKADFYSAYVTTPVNDNACPMPSNATLPSWMCDSTVGKWLILCCSAPTYGNPVEYGYTYIPKVLSVSDTVCSQANNGTGISKSLRFRPLSFDVDSSCQHRVSFPGSYSLLTSEQLALAANTKVIIYGDTDGWCENGDLKVLIRRWNECAALYNILTQRFGVPKSNIQTVIPDWSNIYDLDFTFSNDFDNDGIDDYDGTLTLETALSNIENEHFGQFLFYYANHHDTPSMSYLDTSPFIPERLQDRINAERLTFVLSCGNANRIAYKYKGTRSVCVAGGDTGMFMDYHDSGLYFSFPFYWLSALANKNLVTDESLPVLSDSNVDGFTNLYEAFNVASDFKDWEQIHEVEYELNMEDFPCGYTTGTYLEPNQSDSYWRTSFGHGDAPQLRIRQISENDSVRVTCNSPDIWIRSSDDGTAYQYSESFRAFEDQQVYIYVKLKNIGFTPYSGGSKLLLFWEKPHVGVPGEPGDLPIYLPEWYNECWVPDMPNQIAEIQINDTIFPGDSCIVKYCWTIPAEVAVLGTNINHVFSAGLDVMLSGFSYTEYDDMVTTIPMREMLIKKNQITINPALLPVSNPAGGLAAIRHRNGRFGLNLFSNFNMNFDYLYDLGIISNPVAPSNDIFLNSNKKVYWQFPSSDINQNWTQNFSNLTQDSYNQLRYYFDGDEALIHNFFSNSISDNYYERELYFGLDFTNYLGVGNVNHQIHPVLIDQFGNSTESLTIKIVEDNVSGGGTVLPGIMSNRMQGNNFELTATNITESSKIEWSDADLNLIDEGQTVVVNRDNIGDVCVLRVTLNRNGSEAYAVATLDGVPAMERVIPMQMGSVISVRLTDTAVEGMSVRIIPVMGVVPITEHLIPVGETDISVPSESLPGGQYIVCLMHNGIIIQSEHILK